MPIFSSTVSKSGIFMSQLRQSTAQLVPHFGWNVSFSVPFFICLTLSSRNTPYTNSNKAPPPPVTSKLHLLRPTWLTSDWTGLLRTTTIPIKSFALEDVQSATDDWVVIKDTIPGRVHRHTATRQKVVMPQLEGISEASQSASQPPTHNIQQPPSIKYNTKDNNTRETTKRSKPPQIKASVRVCR